jgi:hypothetical protein
MNVARIMSMFAIFVLLAAVASTAQSNRSSQTFDTSAGPVKVTPLYHATMLIEAGGKIFTSIQQSPRVSADCQKPT